MSELSKQLAEVLKRATDDINRLQGLNQICEAKMDHALRTDAPYAEIEEIRTEYVSLFEALLDTRIRHMKEINRIGNSHRM